MAGRRDLFFMMSFMAFFMTIVIGGMVIYLRTREVDSNIFSVIANNTIILTQLCAIGTIGLFLTLLFAILSWRNGVGVREEERHQDILDAMERTNE